MVKACNSIKLILLIVFSVFLFSCANMATSKLQYAGTDLMLQRKDYATAIRQIEAAKETGYTQKEKVLYYLDIGMLYHFNRNYRLSNEYLQKAEDAIEELFTRSISREAASYLLNDNAKEYSGEDYEDIYLNIFKALNYLALSDSAETRKEKVRLFDDAFVEIRRINNKLNVLEDKYKKQAKVINLMGKTKTQVQAGKNKFHNDILGRYLSMLMYRATDRLDEAEIDLKKIDQAWQLQAHLYNFPKPDFSKALKVKSKAKLNILAFTGRSPDKRQHTFYVHSEKNRFIFASTSEYQEGGNIKLNGMDDIYWEGVEPGMHFKLPVIEFKKLGSNVGRIEVIVDGNKHNLMMVEDMENIAQKTFAVKEPIIFFKTLIRSITKGIASHKFKQNNAKSNDLGGALLRLATDVMVDATENADLRISRFFPAFAYTTEIMVDPGKHDIAVKYYHKNGALLITEEYKQFEVSRKGLNLIETFYIH